MQTFKHSLVALASAFISFSASAGEFRTVSATGSSQLPSWSSTSVYDGNNGSCWSSNNHSRANESEWLAYWWAEGFQNTNFVKILPRYSNGRALGFPTNFTIAYSNGSRWIDLVTLDRYPTPTRGDWIIIPLPKSVYANGIQIKVNALGHDDGPGYYFQLAEAKAGYDNGYEKFKWLQSNIGALPGKIQVSGTGSGAFDPNKLSNWNYDERGSIITPNNGKFQNLYAPQAVYQGNKNWKIFFGGWDGAATENDSIHLSITGDNFGSFGAHKQVINNGAFIHANNDSVVQAGPNEWRMVYTAYGTQLNGLNKPAYAVSTDGMNWTPSTTSVGGMLTMAHYPGWARTDANGANTLFKENNKWHLFFSDFTTGAVQGVLHAESNDGVNFTYIDNPMKEVLTMQDMKTFQFNGVTYYVANYHHNADRIWMSVSTNLKDLGSPTTAFTNRALDDRYIVASGFVQDGKRIYGILYGASGVRTLDKNRIFASWLQKKVIFQNNHVRWGDIERGFGPDAVRVYMAAGDELETGRFYIYDTDGTTLLFTSPEVTMRAGDVWEYLN